MPLLRSSLLVLLHLLLISAKSQVIIPYVINATNADSEEQSLLQHVYILENSHWRPFSSSNKSTVYECPQHFLFALKNTQSTKTGYHLIFGNKYVRASSIFVKRPLPQASIQHFPNANSLAVQLDSGAVLFVGFTLNELDRADANGLSIKLQQNQFFEVQNNYFKITQSFMLGLFAFLALFNVIVYSVTHWWLYLKYALYILSALVYFSFHFGLLQVLFPALYNLPLNIAYTWYSIIYISYFYFLNDFGNYKIEVPKAYQLLNIGILFKLTESTINTVFHYSNIHFIYSKFYTNLIIGLEIVLMFSIVYYVLKNKSIRGRIVILAAGILIVTAIIEQLKLLPNTDSVFLVEIGVLLDLLTFSVGLGYITKRHFEDKLKAEKKFVQQLQENQRIQHEQKKLLENTVEERTKELVAEKLLVEKKNNENELLLAEVHHRVKNNLQVIASLLNLHERAAESAQAKQVLQECRERIKSLELVHKMLYSNHVYGSISLKEYLKQLAVGLFESFGANEDDTVLHLPFNDLQVDLDTAIPMGLILNELLVNALKHARIINSKLLITINILEENNYLVLKFNDNGTGNAEQIIKMNSFGFKIVRSLVRQLQGELHLSNNNGLQYHISILQRSKTTTYENIVG